VFKRLIETDYLDKDFPSRPVRAKSDGGEMTQKVGSNFLFEWPKIFGVLSTTSVEKIHSLLMDNPIVTVTEKLDGSNLCLSSEGWIASRRRIILVDPTQTQLDAYKFNGVSLASLESLLPKVKQVAEKIRLVLKNFEEIEILLFGEWIQKGTASCKEDKFKYADRGIKTGQMYVFGIGIYVPNSSNNCDIGKIKKTLANNFKWNYLNVYGKSVKYLIVCVNKALEKFLKGLDIECVPILSEIPIRNVLTEDKFVQSLVKRELEGFVLSTEGAALKWKTFEAGQRTSQKYALGILEGHLKGERFRKVLLALREVSEMLEKEDRQASGLPPGKPSVLDYLDICSSAQSKFPHLCDLINANNFDEAPLSVFDIVFDYEKMLFDEMLNDFTEMGLVDEDHELKLKCHLRAMINTSTTIKMNKKFF